MKRFWLMAASAAAMALAGVAGPAAAQTPTAEGEAGVTGYPAAFFTEFRPVTAMDMLGRIPGFTFEGGSSARGFAGTAGNVLIDGQRPPSRGDSLSEVVGRIPASSVERIDIVRGGAGGLDMQGKTIIANIIRTKDQGLKGAATVSATAFDDGGLYRRGELQLQRQANGRTLEGSFTVQGQELPYNRNRVRVDPQGVLLVRGQSTGKSAPRTYTGTGVAETPFAAGSLRLNLRLQYQQNHFLSDEALIFPGGHILNRNLDHDREGEVGLRFSRKFGSDLGLEAVAFQRLHLNDNDDDYIDPGFTARTESHTRSGETIANAKLKWGFREDWSLEGGVEGAYNFVDARAAYFLNGAGLDLAGDQSLVKELRTEAFGVLTWQPKPKLSLEAGARYEYSTITAEGSAGDADSALGYLKPRAVLSWTPRDHHQLLFRLERTVDQLSFDSFAASASFSTGTFGIGNSRIEPQKTWIANARYEFSFARQGSFLIDYTRQDITDFVSSIVVFAPDPSGGPAIPVDIAYNVPHATRDILVASGAAPLDDLGFTGGLFTLKTTWKRSRMEDPVTGVLRRIGGDRPAEWSATLSQNIVSRRISWSLTASGFVRTRSFTARQLGYSWESFRLASSMSWQATDRLTVSAGLYNIPGGRSYNGFVLYGGPRSTASPRFREDTVGRYRRQAYVTIRRSF